MPTMPAIRIPVSIRTTEVLADGSARYDAVMGAPSLAENSGDNPMGQMIGPALSMMDGAKTSAWVDARGQTLDARFEMPDSANPMLAQALGSVTDSFQGQMQQMSAPFPAEAIGIGARWQVTTAMQLMGIGMSLTSDYTLVARDGDIVELAVNMTQTLDADAASVLPGITPGEQAALTGFSSESAGTMIVDLGNAVAHSEVTTEQSIPMGSVAGAGPAPTMSMRMTVTPEDPNR
jgi:hypothetical protein